MNTLTGRLSLSLLLLCVSAIMVAAQGSATTSVAGKYEGTAKGPDGDVNLSLELVDEAGKISGQITSPHGVYKIVKAQLAAGVLTLDAEGANSKGKLVLRQKGETLA